MNDKDKDNEDGGFHLSTDGINCLPCRCRRNLYHKATVKQLMKIILLLLIL